jgi:hypothetical protein
MLKTKVEAVFGGFAEDFGGEIVPEGAGGGSRRGSRFPAGSAPI